jgi:hypothetical protein
MPRAYITVIVQCDELLQCYIGPQRLAEPCQEVLNLMRLGDARVMAR